MTTPMQHDRRTSTNQKTVAPSYDPGNSLHSATESLTAQDIENHFRIAPTRSSSSTKSIDDSRWNKGVIGDIDSETTVNSSTSQQFANTTVSSSINNRLSRLNVNRDDDRECMSDIEGRTDSDDMQNEADKEEIRQIFGTRLSVYSQKDKILSIIETNSITIIQGNTGSGKSTQMRQYI
ncbi:unnamed protein product [Rotaria sordida]|uniref:Uncharacterized protein n=2 Tax=Rotaria sordida TaxID=392033 RepID=A0A814WC48_9BILA|nr:unnamed protein product [Rotaria sordida]